jgi:PiT family inorganic phosphate transporter
MDKINALIALIILGSAQGILIGILGAPNIVSTMIASRAMSPRNALILSTCAQFIGPFLFGVAAATVIGSQVVAMQAISPLVINSALIAAVIGMIFSFNLRIPSSSTHAIFGGLLGAVVTASGLSGINVPGMLKVLTSLLLSAPMGLLGGFLMVRICYWLAKYATPRINRRFNQGQWLASFGLGMTLGSINAQNSMGIITLGLVLNGDLSHFYVPLWVVAWCATGLALGNLLGGMRLIKSVGARFFPIRPVHGFSAELASAVIIGVSSLLGGNVSTTHITSFSIVGAGAAERLSMVRWGFVRNVLITWISTIPFTAVISGIIYESLNHFGMR